MTSTVHTTALPDAYRLLTSSARITIDVTAEDGSTVYQGGATVVALDNQPSGLTLIAVTDCGQEIRIPTGGGE